MELNTEEIMKLLRNGESNEVNMPSMSEPSLTGPTIKSKSKLHVYEREVIVKFNVRDFIRVQKLIENDQKKRDYNRNYARTNNGSQSTRKSRVQPIQYEVISEN